MTRYPPPFSLALGGLHGTVQVATYRHPTSAACTHKPILLSSLANTPRNFTSTAVCVCTCSRGLGLADHRIAVLGGVSLPSNTMAAPSVAAPELRAPSPPASTYATTPLELADVLAQLPPDVVDANVWARTDNVHAFKLTSRAARQLVHATKRCVDLGPSCWTGCPSGDGAAAAPGMVAALSRYTVLDTLTAKADVAAEPERACRRRPAAPWVSTPSKLAEKPQASRVVDFLAAGSLSQLRTVELRLGRALGLDVAALAVLPHLTSCGVYFASASEAAFQLEVDAAGMLSKGLLTLQLGLDRVERAVAGVR